MRLLAVLFSCGIPQGLKPHSALAEHRSPSPVKVVRLKSTPWLYSFIEASGGLPRWPRGGQIRLSGYLRLERIAASVNRRPVDRYTMPRAIPATHRNSSH